MKCRLQIKIALILFVLLPISCIAQPSNNWKTHNVFSMKITLPSFFTEGTKDEYNTYNFPNTVSKSISLNVECLIASPKFTPATLDSYHDDCLPQFSKITYSITRDSFFILSGIDKKGKILYIKGVKKEGSYFGLALNYSSKFKALFDRNLTKISSSFE